MRPNSKIAHAKHLLRHKSVIRRQSVFMRLEFSKRAKHSGQLRTNLIDLLVHLLGIEVPLRNENDVGAGFNSCSSTSDRV
jgi:hypothetical protein